MDACPLLSSYGRGAWLLFGKGSSRILDGRVEDEPNRRSSTLYPDENEQNLSHFGAGSGGPKADAVALYLLLGSNWPTLHFHARITVRNGEVLRPPSGACKGVRSRSGLREYTGGLFERR